MCTLLSTFEYRGRAWEVSGLFDVHTCIAVALIEFGIAVLLQVGETKSRAVGGTPHLVGLLVLPLQSAVDGARTLNRLDQLHAAPPHHQADGVLAVPVGVANPLAEHAVGFAATACAAKEHLEDRTFEQRDLRGISPRSPSY